MDIKELKERYLAGQRNFSSINLSGLSVKSIDLDGVDFSNADLHPYYLI